MCLIDQIIYAYDLMLGLHVFRQTWPPRRVDCLALTTCLPHKDRGIPLSALPKDTTSKLAGLFSKDKIYIWTKDATAVEKQRVY